MDLTDPGSVTIKVEPGTGVEGGGDLPHTDIDVDLQDVKKECLEYSMRISPKTETISRCANFTDPLSFTVKVEPGAGVEGGGDLPHTDKDIDLQDVKKECLEYSMRISPTTETISRCADLTDPRSLTVKVEPGTGVEGGGDLPHTDIDIDLQDISKKECLENSLKIDPTTVTLPKESQYPQTELVYSSSKSFSCPDCNCSFSRKRNLKFHMLSHSGEKQFSCSNCNYSCSRKDSLKLHMLTHNGKKPFSCPDCNYSCVRNWALRRHVLTHSGKKPFSCPDCDYSYTQKESLKVHMLIHSGKKPFSCPNCEYSCSRKGSLKLHMMIHSEEKPLSCPECDYSCIRKGSLKVHMLIHSGEKPF